MSHPTIRLNPSLRPGGRPVAAPTVKRFFILAFSYSRGSLQSPALLSIYRYVKIIVNAVDCYSIPYFSEPATICDFIRDRGLLSIFFDVAEKIDVTICHMTGKCGKGDVLMSEIKVVICGAFGNMGREAVKAVSGEDNLELVGALDIKNSGEDLGQVMDNRPSGIIVSEDLKEMLKTSGAEVMVDFTAPSAVMQNIHTALENRVTPVVGTTGLTEPDLKEIEGWIKKYETGVIIAPNFALGAILMMKFARLAARFLPEVEIIELHHENKIDAPSGTAIKTAQMIREGRKENSVDIPAAGKPEEIEKIPGARGGKIDDINVHSIRLPGKVAHQEVIFGGNGQTLTIRHDSIDRRSFMPGLIMAINEAPRIKELIYGIENLIEF